MRRSLWHIGGTCLLLLGCNSTEFRGKKREEVVAPQPKPTPLPKVEESTEHTINFTCRDVGNGVLATRIDLKKSDTIVVEGDFCPDADLRIEEKTVLFLVDFSGSMRVNDPLVNESCKRYEALQSAIQKIAASPNADRFIKVGVVGFETDSKKIVNLSIPSNVSNQITARNLCVYGGSTNYQDAFNQSYDMIRGLPGTKDIYFISDGLPTVSSFDSVAKQRVENDEYRISSVEIENLGFQKDAPGTLAAENGLSAARYLREQVSGTNIIAFFLKGEDNNTSIGAPVDNPTKYLAAITGNPLNVKLVERASELVTEISDFANVPVESLNVEKPILFVDYGGDLKDRIQTSSFEKLGERKFAYRSVPFKLSKRRNEYNILWKANDNRDRVSQLSIELEANWQP